MASQLPGPAGAPTPLAPPSAPPAWAALTDRGRVRGNNEDAWGAFALEEGPVPLAARPEGWPRHGVLFVVSDGMGGARAGEEASRFCIERLPVELLAHLGAGGGEAALDAALRATHAALTAAGLGNPAWHGMGATLSTLWLRPPGAALLGHVGDSRIYGRHAGAWRRCTEDHTLGEGLVRRGTMTPEAAAAFRFRSLLEQVMGGDGRALAPQVAPVPWQPGDAAVLCSDGLYRALDGDLEPRLAAAVREARLEDGARGLVDAANAAGGPDNITVLLVRAAEAGEA